MRLRVAAVTLALLAGCGGDAKTKDDTGGAGTMSASAWAGKVDAICRKSRAKAERVGERVGRESATKGDSKAELTAKVLDATGKLVGPWMDQVDALPKPQGKEQQATRFSGEMRKSAGLLEQVAQAIRANDETTGKRVTGQLLDSVKSARALATQLGIAECNPPASGSFG